MKKNTQAPRVAESAKSARNTKAKTSAEKSLKPTKPKKSATTSVMAPASLNIRSYQVGFGDCFLLTFNYPEAAKADDRMRHILIDFGSTALPPGTPPDQMMRVALDIKEKCGGKLHVVVATHRHKDHISGFTTQEDGSGTGDVIARLSPEAVIRPWTEDPEAVDPVISSPKSKKGNSKMLMEDDATNLLKRQAMHVSSLKNMHTVSEAMLAELRHISDERTLKQPLGAVITEKIRFLADDNRLPNKSAVENLKRMGKNYYVNHGSKLNLSKLLPGIGISVLGPPTLEQYDAIAKQRSADKNEFWMLRAAAQKFWEQQAATGKMLEESTSDKKFTTDKDELFPTADVFEKPDPDVHSKDELFPDADVISKVIPPHNRWFVRQIRAMRGEQMLGLVRILDKALNNTSVILLFDVGGKKLLFPGDAQIENWEYALSIDEDVEQLRDVAVYKVGHHGSRNATPKSLWKSFDHKSEEETDKNRLKTLISTMEGKHGSHTNHSEVPRQTLVDALKELSEYHTTQTAVENNKLFEDLEIILL